MIVEPLSDEKEWENFVADSPKGTFYHTLKWRRVLEASFPVEPVYLVIRDSNRNLVGVCPFVIWREMKVMKVLDSLLHSDYGGPLVKEGYADEVLKTLGDYIRQLALKKGITYARIRFSDENLSQVFSADATKTDTYAGTMWLDLQQKPTEFIWNEVFTNREAQRKYIRRFEQDDYRLREANLNSQDLATFYSLYSKNLLQVGGLPFRFQFFENMRQSLYPDNFKILLAEKRESSIGALGFYLLKSLGVIYLTYLGLDRNLENKFHTSHYLYWEALKWAEENGYHHVSFGGTAADPDEVHRRLKSKFGAEFKQDYIVYLPFCRKIFALREMAFKLYQVMETKLPRPIMRKLLGAAQSH